LDPKKLKGAKVGHTSCYYNKFCGDPTLHSDSRRKSVMLFFFVVLLELGSLWKRKCY